MEEVLPYIFVIVAVVFSIIKQTREEARKKAAGTPDAPMPEAWPQMPPVEEEEPLSQPTVPSEKPKKRAPKPFIPKAEPSRAYRASAVGVEEGQASTVASSTPPLVEAEEESSEFAINTPEEARRAIIYSEIMGRKY